MKRIALFLFLIFSSIPSFAQTQIDPTYQIQWNLLSGSGAPSITCTQNGNYTVYPYGAEWGQSYQDTTNNVEYKCTASGWVKNLPATGGTITGGLQVTGTMVSTGWAPSGGIATGDSTGFGAFGQNAPDAGYTSPQGFPRLLGDLTPGGMKILATSGSMMGDVNEIQLAPLGTFPAASAPRITIQDGINDGGTYGTSSNQQAIFAAEDLFALIRAIPQENTIEASSGLITIAPSCWTYNATRVGIKSPTLESATAGCTLSFPITVPSSGVAYISYVQIDGNTNATATVQFDSTTVGTLNSGNAGTTGNCICTIHNTNQSPFAARFTGLTPGLQTVTITTQSNSGGAGFSFLSASTQPTTSPAGLSPSVSGSGPQVYEGGITLTENYSTYYYQYDPLDLIIRQNIAALQSDGEYAIYICGLSNPTNYNAFVPGSALQQACSTDVPTRWFSNAWAPISTTAWNSATATLTIVSTGAISGITVGQSGTVSGTTTHPEISNTKLWNVTSVSGSTITLTQPSFSGVTWSATSDTAGQFSPYMYNTAHMNSQGQIQMARAYNHYMKLTGGGNGPFVPIPLILPAILGDTSGFYIADCETGTGLASITMPGGLNGSGAELTIENIGAVPCTLTVTGIAINIPATIQSHYNSCTFQLTGQTWWGKGCTSGPAYLSLGQIALGSSYLPAYTVTGVEGSLRLQCTSVGGANTVNLPFGTTTVGPMYIGNFGTSPCFPVGTGGAYLEGFPVNGIPQNQTMQVMRDGSGYWWPMGTSWADPQALSLGYKQLGPNYLPYALTGSEGILELDPNANSYITIGTNPANGDTVTVNGTVVTFVTSGATGNQVNLGGTAALTATALRTMLSASSDTNLVKSTYTNPSSGVVLATPTVGSFVQTFATSVPAKMTFSVAFLTISAGIMQHGPFTIINNGTVPGPIVFSGVTNIGIPTIIQPGKSVVIACSGANICMWSGGSTAPTTFNLSYTTIGYNIMPYTMAGYEGIIQASPNSTSGIILPALTTHGPFFINNVGSAPLTLTASAGIITGYPTGGIPINRGVILTSDAAGNYYVQSPVNALPSIRAGTWSISSSTSVAVTFATGFSSAPTSCSVMPTASSATTGQPYPTTLATTGFTVNVPISGTLAGTYQCEVNNAN